jgi:hypothetical protein
MTEMEEIEKKKRERERERARAKNCCVREGVGAFDGGGVFRVTSREGWTNELSVL